jgi:hypothetical protein
VAAWFLESVSLACEEKGLERDRRKERIDECLSPVQGIGGVFSRPRCAIQRVKHLLFFQSCDLMNNQVYFRGYGNKGIAFAVPIVLHFS